MKSMRRQLAVAVCSVAVFVLLGGGLALFFSLHLALTSAFDESLRTKADALVTASEIEGGEFEIDMDVQEFAGFGSNRPGDYYEIFTRDGSVLQRSPSLGATNLPDIPAASTQEEGVTNLNLPEEKEGRAFWTTFTPAGAEDDSFINLQIVVASDLTSLDRTIRIVGSVMAVFVVTGIAVALVSLGTVVRRNLSPLDQLGDRVEKIDADRLTERLPTQEIPVELQPVVRKTNELLERLSESFARERRFSSYAAHELRTPLAELKSMLQLGESWPDELSSEQIREMLNMVGDLEQLTEKLTTLSRAESGKDLVQEPIPLGRSIQDVIEASKFDIETRKLQIQVEVEDGPFHSDPVLWYAILSNLVGNAIAYAPEESCISIAASPSEFRISNEAPELSSDDLPHVFERFWKGPSPVAQKIKHSGLGLSIVRASAEYLGGTCDADLQEARFEVRIRWP